MSVINVAHPHPVAVTSAGRSNYLWLGCSSEVPAGGRIDDVYDDHRSSDTGVLGKRVRGNDVHPVAAIKRSRTCRLRLGILRQHAVGNANKVFSTFDRIEGIYSCKASVRSAHRG